MTDREPQIGDIVHVRHGGACLAAIVTYVDDDETVLLHVFPTPFQGTPAGDKTAYTSLASARPTSGWHWKDEEHEGLR